MNIKTPQQLAAFIAFLLGVFVSLCYAVVSLLILDDMSIWITIILFFSVSILGYFILYYLLEKYIVSRIRVLYRAIHSYKIKKSDFPISMSEDVLGKTEQEVNALARINKEEIEKLKYQEEYRREFIGNLAHELRTPIFSIQGYILTLLEGGLEDPSINRKFLERAAKGVDRMTSIVEDLDVITKIESGRLGLDLKQVELMNYIKEILESFEQKAEKENVKLIIDSKLEDQVFVKCDKHKIGQVLTNLINNAILYGKDGGMVIVRLFDFEDHILVEVADKGPGIDPDKISRLFERFYRVEKSRSRHEGGSGLGLSIAKHIVEAHGQMIDVRSSVGKGSTFSFTLEKMK